MNEVIRWCQVRSLQPLLLAAVITLLSAVAAAMVWSRETHSTDDIHAVSSRLMQQAYDKVVPGKTSEPELAALGFDKASVQVRALSGLGVQEYFMARTSAGFDQLDPAVKACFEPSDRCTALVFPLAARAGGFMAANAAPVTSGRVVFLIRSGRVAYKAVQPG